MAKNETYEEFLQKFEPKKTTDDCYTPPAVYKAVENWVASRYGLDPNTFVRPFYPGGDYEKFDYNNKIVVDNPPFSILAQIIKFYVNNNIKFFMFAPTLVGLTRYSDYCTAIPVGISVTYENGAKVNTSFVTNLEPNEIRMMSAPKLYQAIKEADKKRNEKNKKKRAKYEYPLDVVTSAQMYQYSRLGIDFSIERSECTRISALDAQKNINKGIFGTGLLLSSKKKAEREKAEREKAEVWELSPREMRIIENLNVS